MDFRLPPETLAWRDELRAFLRAELPDGFQGSDDFFDGAEQVPFVRANGVVAAFDRQQSKLRWKQQISEQNLLIERLDHSPLLVFASRKYERNGRLQFSMQHIVALDKLSGAKLLDNRAAAQQGIRSVNVSLGERYIELRGFNDRIRLYPIDKSAVAGESGD